MKQHVSLPCAFVCLLAFSCCAPLVSAAERGEGLWPCALNMPPQIQAELDARKRKKKQIPVLAWTPQDARKIRGMLVLVANTDAKLKVDEPQVVKVVAFHSMAVRLQIALNGERGRAYFVRRQFQVTQPVLAGRSIDGHALVACSDAAALC